VTFLFWDSCFRQQKDDKKKSNLLLILTPYIVREQADLRKNLRAQDAGAPRVYRPVLRLRKRKTGRRLATTRALTDSLRIFVNSTFKSRSRFGSFVKAAPTARLHRQSQPIDLPRLPTNVTRQGTPGVPAAPGALPAGAPISATGTGLGGEKPSVGKGQLRGQRSGRRSANP